MYESFYGLSAKPFQLNPDPSFYYGSKEHRRAMAYLDYGLHKSEGFIVITGEAPTKLTITDRTGRPLTAADAQSLRETGVRILMRPREGARALLAVSEETARPGLSEIVGQERVVEELQAIVAGAKKKEVPTLAPILLEGEAGHGKTVIAQAVASDLGSKPTVISHPGGPCRMRCAPSPPRLRS